MAVYILECGSIEDPLFAYIKQLLFADITTGIKRDGFVMYQIMQASELLWNYEFNQTYD